MTMPAIRLSTLGRVSCTKDDSELTSLTAQPRRVALLVYLALAEPRGFHSRDRLLALFWPDHDEQRARNALSQALHFIRRTVAAEAVVTGADDQLRIDPALIWSDVVAFEEALRAGRTAEALELYRGQFLDGFHISAAAAEFEQWVDAERSRLSGLYTRALRVMAQQHEDAADFAGAVLWHRKLVQADPLSSRATLGLMRALAAAGESESALQHARIHETLVREELQAAPDPEIAAFVRELRNGSPPVPPNVVKQPVAAVPGANASVASHSKPNESNGRWSPRRRVGMAAAAALASAVVLVPAARRHADSAPRIQCVAVLPFENISGDTSLEYFAESLTGSMITQLGRYQYPESRSRSSVEVFKGSNKPLPEIGRALTCDGIVEGSITRHGRVLHVDVEALYAPEDRHLWAESFENDTSMLLPLERGINTSVTEHVLRLAGVTPAAALPPSHRDPVAYHLYIKGRDAFRSRNPTATKLAIAYFRQAVERDSTFAAAYAGLADAYGLTGSQGYGPLDYLDSSRKTVAHALAVDSTSSDAHTSMAAILASDGEWSKADAEFRRAIELDHGNALAYHWYAMMLAVLNRKDEAVEKIRKAADIDPMSQSARGTRTEIEFLAGIKHPLGNPGTIKGMVDQTHLGTNIARGIQLAQKHRCPEAYEASRKAQELGQPDNPLILIGLSATHLFCGKPADAHTVLRQLRSLPNAPLFAVYIAGLYTAEHQVDSAFAVLDKGRWMLSTYFELRVNRNLNPLRGDPRFDQLLQRLRIPSTS